MVFYVTEVTFLIKLLMNKFTNRVLDYCDLDEIHAHYGNKDWYFLHPNNHVLKCSHG